MTARNLYDTFGASRPEHFPEMADGASLIASLFQMLGGTMVIDETGARRVIIPEPCAFDEMPALPNARPHEQFHRPDEYRGAMKLVTGLLQRLHPKDATFVYDAFAVACVEVH